MTDAEIRRRVYLETANAIRFYLSSTKRWVASDIGKEDLAIVHERLLNSAHVFQNAATAILESQEAGVP